MKKEQFLNLVNLYKTTRGPNPKQETIDGAIKYLDGKKCGRYSVRLVEKVIEFSYLIKSDDKSIIETLRLYAIINKLERDMNYKAVKSFISGDSETLSKAATLNGVYSARVYKMHTSLLSFHELRLKIMEN